MKYLYAPFIFLFLSIPFLAFSNENPTREPKVLVLIVASDDLPIYVAEQEIWRSYMHLDREHFEAYFIKANPGMQSAYEIDSDIIWSKVANNVSTGMVDRTVSSIEALMPRIDEFDYVLRTNLSSFYIFPRLLKFISTLPRENCYCGMAGYHGAFFVSGAGCLLSRDLVKRMVHEKQSLLAIRSAFEEDVILGRFFQERHIGTIPASRMDFYTLREWMSGKDSIPENIFHFRLRNTEDRRMPDEALVQLELVKMFYIDNKS